MAVTQPIRIGIAKRKAQKMSKNYSIKLYTSLLGEVNKSLRTDVICITAHFIAPEG